MTDDTLFVWVIHMFGKICVLKPNLCGFMQYIVSVEKTNPDFSIVLIKGISLVFSYSWDGLILAHLHRATPNKYKVVRTSI